MVSVLASRAIDRGCEPSSGQINDNKIGNCCFSAKHSALRSKSKDCLARNQDNVFREEQRVYPQTVVSHNVVLSTPRLQRDSNSQRLIIIVVIGTDCTSS